MKEKKLIASLGKSRESYNKILPLIVEKDLTDFGSIIFNEIKQFYETDVEAQRVDWDLIQSQSTRKYPKLSGLITEYLSSLPEEVSVENTVKLFSDVCREKLGFEIIQAITSQNENKAKELMEKYLTHEVEDVKEEVFNAVPIYELEEHYNSDNLIPVYPSHLNGLLGGGVPRQTQICIFARPDVGKSTVAINMAVGAAESGFRVLYIGNEDPPATMVFRILTRFCRVTIAELRTDTKKYFDVAMQRGYGNMFFVPMHPGRIGEIRSWIEKVKPDMVIIDQIRNLHVNTEDGTTNLEEASKATRNLAKEFNLVMVVVTQAGNSAAGKLRLEMEDVDNSKTGLQGAMDLMIGVGQNEEAKRMGRIMLSFPKNKFTAPIQPFSAEINYETNRVLA